MPLPVVALLALGAGAVAVVAMAAGAAEAEPEAAPEPELPGGGGIRPPRFDLDLVALDLDPLALVGVAFASIMRTPLVDGPYIDQLRALSLAYCRGEKSREQTKREALEVLWRAATVGLEGYHDRPIGPQGTPAHLARVAARFMASPKLSPWKDPFERGRKLEDWLGRAANDPPAAATYWGFPFSDILADNAWPDKGQGTWDSYHDAVGRPKREHVNAWAREWGLSRILGGDPYPSGRGKWKGKHWIDNAPSAEAAESLCAHLSDAMEETIALKLLVWPMGPASAPVLDWGQIAEWLGRLAAAAATFGATELATTGAEGQSIVEEALAQQRAWMAESLARTPEERAVFERCKPGGLAGKLRKAALAARLARAVG